MCGNYIRLKQLMNMIGRQLAVLSPEHSANLMGSACSALILAENPKKIGVDISPASPAFWMYAGWLISERRYSLGCRELLNPRI